MRFIIQAIISFLVLRIALSKIIHTPPKNCWNMTDFHDAVHERNIWSHQLLKKVDDIENAHFHFIGDKTEDLHTFDALGPPRRTLCNERSLKKYGIGEDGRWDERWVCGLEEYAISSISNEDQKNEKEMENDCFIISVGGNDEWSFEEGMYDATNCHIHTFDCTVGKNVQPPNRIKSRVMLHRFCFGVEDIHDTEKPVLAYLSMLELTKGSGHVRKPAFMKIDIEGFEWMVIPNMIDDHEMNALLPDQIAFELHYITWVAGSKVGALLSWGARGKTPGKTAAEVGLFMDHLWKYGKYFLVNRADNLKCGSCSELLIARPTQDPKFFEHQHHHNHHHMQAQKNARMP